MIQSCDWKEELARIARTIRRVKVPGRWSERAHCIVERDLMIAATDRVAQGVIKDEGYCDECVFVSCSSQACTPQECPESTGQALAKSKNPATVALGRLGGLKDGTARAAKLSGHKRKSI
jgi:hypothetical protein